MATDQKETWSNLPESENEYSVYFHYEDGELLAGRANCNGLQGWGIALQEGIFVFGKFRDGKLIVDATPMASWLFETFEFVSKERGCLEFSNRVIGQNRYLFGVELPQNKFVGFSLCVDGTLSTHIIDDVSHIDTVNAFYANDTILYFKIKPQEFVKEISKVDFYMQCGAKPEFMQVNNDNIIGPEALVYGEKYKLKINIVARTFRENNKLYSLYDVESITDSKGNKTGCPFKYILAPYGSNIRRIFPSSKWELPKLILNPIEIFIPTYENKICREYSSILDDFCTRFIDARQYGGNIQEMVLVHKSIFENEFRVYTCIKRLHPIFDFVSILYLLFAIVTFMIHVCRIGFNIQPHDKLDFILPMQFPNNYIIGLILSFSLYNLNRYRVIGFLGIIGLPIFSVFMRLLDFENFQIRLSEHFSNIYMGIASLVIVISITVALILSIKDKSKRTMWRKIVYLNKPRHREKPCI